MSMLDGFHPKYLENNLENKILVLVNCCFGDLENNAAMWLKFGLKNALHHIYHNSIFLYYQKSPRKTFFFKAAAVTSKHHQKDKLLQKDTIIKLCIVLWEYM